MDFPWSPQLSLPSSDNRYQGRLHAVGSLRGCDRGVLSLFCLSRPLLGPAFVLAGWRLCLLVLRALEGWVLQRQVGWDALGWAAWEMHVCCA